MECQKSKPHTCKCLKYGRPYSQFLLKDIKKELSFVPRTYVEGDNANISPCHGRKVDDLEQLKTKNLTNDNGHRDWGVVWNSKLTVNTLVNNLRSMGTVTGPRNNDYSYDSNLGTVSDKAMRQRCNAYYYHTAYSNPPSPYENNLNGKDSFMKISPVYPTSLRYTVKQSSRHRGSLEPNAPVYYQSKAPIEKVVRKHTDRAILAEKGLYLHSCIGKGNFSKVVVGSDPSGSQLFAVKIVDLNTAPLDFKSKFLPRELRIWPTLSHKNIVRMYTSFRRDDKIYVMLEYACNGDMLEFIQKHGRQTEAEAHRWFLQMGSAIRYLHDNMNIAHRDLKLENLLLDCCLNIKVADFGFCRELSYDPGNAYDQDDQDDLHTASMTQLSQTYCGSKSYASPEILKSTPYDPKRADIWSMGVIICVWVSCHMPFNEKLRTTDKLIASQRCWKVETLRTWTRLSTHCEDFISKLLAFQPVERSTISQALDHPWIRKDLFIKTESVSTYRPRTAPLPIGAPQTASINVRPKSTAPHGYFNKYETSLIRPKDLHSKRTTVYYNDSDHMTSHVTKHHQNFNNSYDARTITFT